MTCQDTCSALTFIYQNNQIRRESIRHEHSGHHHTCTMRRILSRVEYLRSQGAPPNTLLYSAKVRSRCRNITSTELTHIIHAACFKIGEELGLHPDNISTQYLRLGGAMPLLLSNIYTYTVYLTAGGVANKFCATSTSQCAPSCLMQGNAETMVTYGYYTLIPEVTLLPIAVCTSTEFRGTPMRITSGRLSWS